LRKSKIGQRGHESRGRTPQRGCWWHPETWATRWWEPGFSGPEINLAVCTGKRSRLMVLEVAKGPGEVILDRYGPWRAECIAVLGGGRERHFYAWQPSPLFDSPSLEGATEFRWYGEGQVILVPPSRETESSETWQWLCPPWEVPPQYPGQPVADFLQQHLTQEPQPRSTFSRVRRRIEPGRAVFSAHVMLNRFNPGELFGPPFPVARLGEI
jgi:hypothetical protein